MLETIASLLSIACSVAGLGYIYYQIKHTDKKQG